MIFLGYTICEFFKLLRISKKFFPYTYWKKKSTYKVLVTQLCPIVCDFMDYSPQSSFVHGILQERIMEWIAIPFSKGSSLPRDWTQMSYIAGRFFTSWTTGEAHLYLIPNIFYHPVRKPIPIKQSFPFLHLPLIPGNH